MSKEIDELNQRLSAEIAKKERLKTIGSELQSKIDELKSNLKLKSDAYEHLWNTNADNFKKYEANLSKLKELKTDLKLVKENYDIDFNNICNQLEVVKRENENLSKGYDDWHNLFCKLKENVILISEHETIDGFYLKQELKNILKT